MSEVADLFEAIEAVQGRLHAYVACARQFVEGVRMADENLKESFLIRLNLLDGCIDAFNVNMDIEPEDDRNPALEIERTVDDIYRAVFTLDSSARAQEIFAVAWTHWEPRFTIARE